MAKVSTKQLIVIFIATFIGLLILEAVVLIAIFSKPGAETTESSITINVIANAETTESLEAIARIAESQDQQCIVKEYVEVKVHGYPEMLLKNEYMTDECSYTQQE